MSGTTVTVDIADGVATLTLIPPTAGKPPTMDLPFFDALEETLTRIEGALSKPGDTARAAAPPSQADPAPVRVVLLRSADARFFCAGGDIAALESLDESTMGAWIDRGHEVLGRLESLAVPVIAVVNGYALGGGLELALASDLIYANENAKLGQTEAKLGFVAGWGGSYRLLRRVGLAGAKELFFRAVIVSASEAYDRGVVDFCGSAPELEARVAATVRDIAESAPASVTAMKRILSALADDTGRAVEGAKTIAVLARELEREESLALVADRETRERVRAFLDSRRRRGGSDGSRPGRG